MPLLAYLEVLLSTPQYQNSSLLNLSFVPFLAATCMENEFSGLNLLAYTYSGKFAGTPQDQNSILNLSL